MSQPLPDLIPPFRDLVRVLEECERTGSPMASALPPLTATCVVLAVVNEAFRADDGGREAVAEGLEVLRRLGATMLRIHAAVVRDDHAAASREARVAAGQLQGLEACAARLGGPPVLSRVPVVDALLQAGRSVLGSGGDWEPLIACLEAAWPSWETLAERADAPAQVVCHGEALQELIRVVNEGDLDGLEAALEAVRATGEALPDSAACPEPAAAAWLCPRCGAEVGRWDRTCPSCHGRLPERLEDEPTRSSLGPSDDLPDYLQALFDEADRLRVGGGDWSRFEASVAEFRRRALISLELLDKVPLPEPGSPRDELQAWHSSQECVEDGLEKFFEALDHLETLRRGLDPQALEHAREAVVSAVAETRRVADVIQRLLEDRRF